MPAPVKAETSSAPVCSRSGGFPKIALVDSYNPRPSFRLIKEPLFLLPEWSPAL